MILTAPHGHEEVEDGPCENDDIVDVHPAGHYGRGVTDPLEEWSDLEDPETTDGQHLAEGQLHEEHRYPGENQGQEIRYEEGAASIFVTQVRKPPNVTETNGKTDLEGEEEDYSGSSRRPKSGRDARRLVRTTLKMKSTFELHEPLSGRASLFLDLD